MSRPVVVSRPIAMSRPAVVSRAPAVARPLLATPRTGTGMRFVPPRMVRQAVSQATAQSIERTLVQRGVTRQVQQQAQNLAATSINSARKVEVVSQPATNRTFGQQPAASSRNMTAVPHQGIQGFEGFKKNVQTLL